MSQLDNRAGEDRQPILQVRGLKVHFPVKSTGGGLRKGAVVRAVDGISFDVHRGETLGIVGESGCGKSTTVRAISQLVRPTEGHVLFRGTDLCSCSRRELLMARQHMQMIFQDPYASLDPRMTVRSIISESLHIYNRRRLLPRELSPLEIERRVEDLMERVGLNRIFKNRYPHEFSGGQRQRIGIARALALDPEVILADEPVSALDVSIQAQILNLLRSLQKELGLTFVFIAHDLAVIQYISDRVCVMYLGKIVETSSSDELYANPAHPYTKALLSAAPIPDPEVERRRHRILLTGDVPSPDKEHKGCYFCERCNSCMAKCREQIPPMYRLGPDHHCACWLLEGSYPVEGEQA